MNNQIAIGSKVNLTTGTYMRNGIVYGLDTNNNRVFVKWPQHGNSSIPSNELVLS